MAVMPMLRVSETAHAEIRRRAERTQSTMTAVVDGLLDGQDDVPPVVAVETGSPSNLAPAGADGDPSNIVGTDNAFNAVQSIPVFLSLVDPPDVDCDHPANRRAGEWCLECGGPVDEPLP